MWTLNLSTPQKILLAVSVPTAGVCAYLLWAYRDRDEDDERFKQNVVTSRMTTINVEIPKRVTGAIIGKGGCKIRQLEEASGARIRFKDDYVGPNGEKLALCRGTQQEAQQAELLIQQVIAETPEPVQITLDVPQWSLGRIIGKNGENIQQLTRSTKCKIKVDRTGGKREDGLKDVTIFGMPDDVEMAKMLVLETVEEEKFYRQQRKVKGATAASEGSPAKQGQGQGSPAKQGQGQGDRAAKRSAEASITPAARRTSVDWPKDYFMVYISAIEHPQHFWLQIINNEDALKLEENNVLMTKYSLTNPKLTEAPRVDSYVLAPLADEAGVFRARVMGITDSVADIYFVDYGDSEYMEWNTLWPMPEKFKSFPHQAHECCLAGIKPVKQGEGTEEEHDWAEEGIKLFEDLTHMAKWQVIMAKVVGFTDLESKQIPLVELCDTGNEKDVFIAQELISRGFARAAGPPTTAPQVEAE